MNILDTLTNEELQFINKRTYLSGQVAFNDHDICTKLGIIIDGELIVSTYTYLEKQEIVTVINKDEMFGHNLLFGDHNNYIGDGIVSRKTIIAFIFKDKVEYLLKHNDNFLKEYISFISNQSYKIKQQAKLLAHKNIEDRIMYYLRHNANNGIVVIKNVTSLAEELSLPRPSVSRSLTKLEMENQIERINKTIYIKRQP